MLLAFVILVPKAKVANVSNFQRVVGNIVKGGKQSNKIEDYYVYNYAIYT